jgi:signal peptidase I
MRTIAMMRVADVLARDAQRHGAVLVHGVLAELDGVGVVLAGTSQVGKSTAARRLPAPWRALADDTVLIAPDTGGGYRAHPWPTWSRFFDGEAEVGDENGSWDVQSPVPLAAVFFLSQAAEDRVEPLEHTAQATALLVDCVEAVSRGLVRDLTPDAARGVRLEALANVEAIVAAVPAFSLEVSLTGEFWRLLERVLDRSPGSVPPGADTTRAFVYTGPSMNPTLAEPQLLETEEPSGAPIRVGDVVCFRSPKDGVTVVHRVVEAGPAGIRTRGDRNPEADPWLLRPEDILGRVVGTRRGAGTGRVVGGRAGVAVAGLGRLRLALGGAARRVFRGAYRGVAGTGVPARLWSRVAGPAAWQEIVRFGSGPLAEHRLYLGERPIGRYDRLQRRWVVDHPYRLVVDVGALPDVAAPHPGGRSRPAV